MFNLFYSVTKCVTHFIFRDETIKCINGKKFFYPFCSLQSCCSCYFNKTLHPKSLKWHHQPNQQPAISVLMNLNGSAPICVSAVRKDPPPGLRLEDLVTYFRIHNVVKVRSLQPAASSTSPSHPSHVTMGTMTSPWGGADVCQEASTPLMRLEAETKSKEKHACRQWEEGINLS